jgi:D-beta-D-heptose 7-phosphate kinase/D-beta-D-heptose 1-phosphate adenosyltransferase
MKKNIGRKRALDIIGRFAGSKVLVVGDIMVDQFIWGKVSRVSPEAPVPVVRVTSESFLLGGCTNVLNNVFSVGGQVAVAGVVGKDDMGRWLMSRLEEMKIDTKGIVAEPGRPTIIKTRVVAHSQQVVRFDRESKDGISEDTAGRIIDYIKSLKDEIGAIVISDYNKGVVTKDLIEKIKEVIRGSNIVLCIDPKQNRFSLYRGCDVITPNHHEAEQALGVEFENDNHVIKGGMALLKEFDFGSVLITRGEEGMTLFEKDGSIMHIPAAAKEIFDVTGAGDTVIGIFALSMAAGATLKEAAALSNHAAGIVVGKIGTATVSQEELKKVL